MAASALLCLANGPPAGAQAPTVEQMYNDARDGQIAENEYCGYTGLCSNGGGQAAPRIGYDPCYLAQNAMRPCTSADMQALQPHGVDPSLAGTWELPLLHGLWVLTIDRGGTYTFHSYARDGVPSHSGTFAASNGSWTMKAKPGPVKYSGSGNYLYQAPNIFIATSQLGAVSWLRPELAQAAMRCAVKPQKAVNPSNLDSHLIGTWKAPVKTGIWVWEIAANGTYIFHSEALDGAPSHSGVFTATKGQWALTATRGLPGYKDNGQYLYQAPNIWMAKGRLGGAAWIRTCDR
jgi:hypothetical protein